MSDPHVHITFTAPEISELAPLFPGYEISNLIATGGMGAVYRAVQKSLDRPVAIKILPQEFSKDAAFCAGFEAEAKAMARLNHPNLISVYDFGEVAGMLYIIMEYVPGKSIFHSAHGIAIDPSEVIRLVSGISNGLAHAHENGIIHRDIKPSNILLDLNAQPKIGDFGLARPVENKIQEGEEIFGTPHYTAPEVVSSPHSVGNRADIFSVGVLLHELLTGRLPAEDRRPASVICGCDPRFDAIIKRASSQIPEARYSSAAEIAQDLQAIAMSAGSRHLRSPSPNIPSSVRKGVPAPAVVKSPSSQTPARSGRSSSSQGSSSKSSSPVIWGVSFVVLLAVVLIIHNSSSSKQTVEKSPSEPAQSTPPPPPTEEIIEKIRQQTEKKPDPTPVPVPDLTPKPEPKPEVAKKPKEGADPDDVFSKKTTAPNTPTFDAAGFIATNQGIVQSKATLLISKRIRTIKDNVWNFERSGLFIIRRLGKGGVRAESRFRNLVTAWKNTNALPKELDEDMSRIPGIPECHNEFYEKQVAIEQASNRELEQLAGAYIHKLESQVEILKSNNDTPAIDIIKEEIDKAGDSQKYFAPLLPAPPPAPETPKTETPKKDDDSDN